MKKIFQLILIILTVWFSQSCVEEECRTETEVVMTANFAVKTDSLWIKATDSDSVLYKQKLISSVQLPLKKLGGKSEFSLKINTKYDTVSIYHTNMEYLVDYNCGCLIYHTIDSVKFTKNQIDSIVIKNSSVDNAAEENIKIYY